MDIVFSNDKSKLFAPAGVGAALGNFDGLHIGHMALIKKVINKSKMKNLKSVVYTFNDHPENIIAGKIITPRITSNHMKVKILQNSGLDYLYFEEFNRDFAQMTPQDFIQKILIKQLNVQLLVVGFDYRFGHKGAGDVNLLKELGQHYGLDVYVVAPVMLQGRIVSSSIIRQYIQHGEIEKVSKFLSREYAIEGQVTKGKNLGSKIGFPTANIIPDYTTILPQEGVYLTNTIIDGVAYDSITNVGRNPTVETIGIRVETHLLNFSGDLYNLEVEVRFIKKIRNEKKFNSIEELSEQIDMDVRYAYEYFGKGIYNKINMC